MTPETQASLDDLLIRWHVWASSAKLVRGWAPKALVCGEYRVSRQYDDWNGALDEALENAQMRAVDFQVSEMAEPYRSAVHQMARALHVGVAVFISPRLPADREARVIIVDAAREMIAKRLQAAGLI